MFVTWGLLEGPCNPASFTSLATSPVNQIQSLNNNNTIDAIFTWFGFEPTSTGDQGGILLSVGKRMRGLHAHLTISFLCYKGMGESKNADSRVLRAGKVESNSEQAEE